MSFIKESTRKHTTTTRSSQQKVYYSRKLPKIHAQTKGEAAAHKHAPPATPCTHRVCLSLRPPQLQPVTEPLKHLQRHGSPQAVGGKLDHAEVVLRRPRSASAAVAPGGAGGGRQRGRVGREGGGRGGAPGGPLATVGGDADLAGQCCWCRLDNSGVLEHR